MPQLCLPSLITKFDGVPSTRELKLGWHGGFRLQQKSMTLNVNLLLCCQSYT